jgi:hypothetical protein
MTPAQAAHRFYHRPAADDKAIKARIYFTTFVETSIPHFTRTPGVLFRNGEVPAAPGSGRGSGTAFVSSCSTRNQLVNHVSRNRSFLCSLRFVFSSSLSADHKHLMMFMDLLRLYYAAKGADFLKNVPTTRTAPHLCSDPAESFNSP